MTTPNFIPTVIRPRIVTLLSNEFETAMDLPTPEDAEQGEPTLELLPLGGDRYRATITYPGWGDPESGPSPDDIGEVQVLEVNTYTGQITEVVS